MFERVKQALERIRQPGSRIWTMTAPTEAGVTITEDSAMRFATVHACVRVLSEDVAALPLHVYRRLEHGGKERDRDHPLYAILHDRPNHEMSAISFFEALMVNALLTGNGYAFIEFDRSGRVKALYPMMSGDVTPYRTSMGELRYNAAGETLAASEVFHLQGLGFDGLVGLSPIAYARESIGLGAAAENFGATFFKNGTNIGGVITMEGVMNDDQFERLKAQFSNAFRGLQRSHGVPVLDGGAKYTPVGIAPEDAQFLETRKFQRGEIAAIYRVPPHMIGDLEHATFSNIEQQDLAYLQRGLLPWLMRIEQEAHAKLVAPGERAEIMIEHDTGNFMRGETSTRMQAYSTAIMAGIMTPNEARARENLNPAEGGDTILLPLNMQAGGQAAAAKQGDRSARKSSGIWKSFSPGGERRAADGKNIAARLAWLGVERKTLLQLQQGFAEWLNRQADDIEKMVKDAGLSMDRALRKYGPRGEHRATAGEMNRLIRSVNDYYDELAERGAQELEEAIQSGAFPGWTDVNDALEKIAGSAWKQVADDLGAGAAPNNGWIEGYMKRYRQDMSLRLCTANRNEIVSILSGSDSDSALDALSGNLAKWRLNELNEAGKWRCGNMAMNEVAMMRNEALIAAYRRAGYSCKWRSAPTCCRFCTNMNGRTVTTLKPPLHKGCVCSVTRGDPIKKGLQPWQEGGKLYSENAVREWIRSDACDKQISQQKQARHIEGTKEYEAYRQRVSDEGCFGPSYIRAGYWTKDNFKRLQRLVRERAGTGEIKIKNGEPWNMIEEIVLGKNDSIGYAVNNRTGKEDLTRCIKIHYSATGVHVVPDYPSKAKK